MTHSRFCELALAPPAAPQQRAARREGRQRSRGGTPVASASRKALRHQPSRWTSDEGLSCRMSMPSKRRWQSPLSCRVRTKTARSGSLRAGSGQRSPDARGSRSGWSRADCSRGSLGSGLPGRGRAWRAIVADQHHVDQKPGPFSGFVSRPRALPTWVRHPGAPCWPGARGSRLHCRSNTDRIYCRRTTPSEEKQVGHSEGIMCPLMLTLGATSSLALPP